MLSSLLSWGENVFWRYIHNILRWSLSGIRQMDTTWWDFVQDFLLGSSYTLALWIWDEISCFASLVEYIPPTINFLFGFFWNDTMMPHYDCSKKMPWKSNVAVWSCRCISFLRVPNGQHPSIVLCHLGLFFLPLSLFFNWEYNCLCLVVSSFKKNMGSL